jgi:hypothetical protein
MTGDLIGIPPALMRLLPNTALRLSLTVFVLRPSAGKRAAPQPTP